MRSFRMHWADEAEEPIEAPRLHSVSRNAPPRPRWTRLYVSLALVMAAGFTAETLAHGAWAVEMIDSAVAVIVIAALIVWLRCNKLALARLSEPAAGASRPQVRIVRSRPPAVARREDRTDHPEERVVLPFDFR